MLDLFSEDDRHVPVVLGETKIPPAGTRASIVAVCIVGWLAMMRLWRVQETRRVAASNTDG